MPIFTWEDVQGWANLARENPGGAILTILGLVILIALLIRWSKRPRPTRPVLTGHEAEIQRAAQAQPQTTTQRGLSRKLLNIILLALAAIALLWQPVTNLISSSFSRGAEQKIGAFTSPNNCNNYAVFGRAWYDANGNGRVDKGESLPGTLLRVRNLSTSRDWQVEAKSSDVEYLPVANIAAGEGYQVFITPGSEQYIADSGTHEVVGCIDQVTFKLIKGNFPTRTPVPSATTIPTNTRTATPVVVTATPLPTNTPTQTPVRVTVVVVQTATTAPSPTPTPTAREVKVTVVVVQSPTPLPTPTARPVSLAPAVGGPFVSSVVETGAFRAPVSGYVVTQGFWGGHNGVDLAVPSGTPVYAAGSGRIIEAGWNGSGYGFTVVIDHGNSKRTRYAHLNTIEKLGDYVTKGQKIGTVGSSGRSTGPHLHFEVLVNGIARNPFLYIRPIPGS